ncbi:cytochrome c oxidase accessory protein CcoG [Rapidithrix thailandica]|uniref:Cytochrome c oxidase accessory protein CcoG n=1 Tax=Rapidithrix thailandica TaxID=413964 RepID=A0AAW9S1X4_9BACT
MATTNSKYQENFRDAISTVDTSGKRVWVYPKKPGGRYYTWRKWTSYLLLALLFSGPFLKIGGQPLLMMNILERKFVIFGSLFTPQDFHIFVLGMILFIIFIVVFTVAFGRIWCGWACPQTIFMEMVFRRIEYWIEGDANQQKKLNAAPWTSEKIRKKTFKYSIFFFLSFLIANTFLGYIVGGDRLLAMVTLPPAENWTIFTALVIFTGVFYWVFASFREQACTTVCPYGRLQGVLLVKETINVAYDYLRGEPRGKLKKNKVTEANQSQGDCIDCKLCVQVCPTGIDIRNGVQLECVNCTACIDACDNVMDKIGKPRGLIRYASEENIEAKKPFQFTPRLMGYTAILVVLLSVIGYSLTSRGIVETTVLRAPGQMFHKAENGNIRNLYTVQVVNKTSEDLPIELKLKQPEGGTVEIVGETILLKAEQNVDGAFFIELPVDKLKGMKTPIEMEVYTDGKFLESVSTTFYGPN